MRFVNRQSEMHDLTAYLTSEPNALLFVYGPKSSGKSTLLEKVINELNTKRYAVNFLDLRGVLIYDFQSFLNVFFPKDFKESAKDIIEGISINLGFFALKAHDEPLLKKNAFKVMEDKLKAARKRGITPVIILDEIQALKHIYLNHGRYLIDELLNLFVRLTKVTHTAHIVCATSESYFIEELYNSAKLKKTMKLYCVDHLSQSAVSEWLTAEGLTASDIDLVWHYLGGCPWEIQQFLLERGEYDTIEDACLYFVNDEYGKLVDYAFRMTSHKEKILRLVIEKIVNNGYCHIEELPEKETGVELLKEMASQDFWFYKTEDQKIIANSQSIYRAFEKMVNQKI